MSNEFYLFIHVAATTSLLSAAAMPFLLTSTDRVSKWLRGRTTDSQHATCLFLVVRRLLLMALFDITTGEHDEYCYLTLGKQADQSFYI